jgi:hypothetical protein
MPVGPFRFAPGTVPGVVPLTLQTWQPEAEAPGVVEPGYNGAPSPAYPAGAIPPKKDYTPYILGGAAALLVLLFVFKKKR